MPEKSEDPIVRDGVVTLREIMSKDPVGGWDTAWKGNVTPWDNGDIQPPLREAIQACGPDLPRSGKALVPGAGTGYDAVYIASSLGLNTVALDISETAVQAAETFFSKSVVKPPGKVSAKQADFFTYTVPDDELYDLAYDYTFFVAIPPSLRPAWGRQITKLVKPGGYLITLVWPLDLPLDGGPPHHVKPEHYDEVLAAGADWEKVLDKTPQSTVAEQHVGRERLVVWKRS